MDCSKFQRAKVSTVRAPFSSEIMTDREPWNSVLKLEKTKGAITNALLQLTNYKPTLHPCPKIHMETPARVGRLGSSLSSS
jgi:hypothetical protein